MFKTALIITIIFFILTIRLSIKINLYYDIFNNNGSLVIKFYNIPIIAFEFDFHILYIQIKNKKKVIKIKLDIHDKNIIFLNNLGKYLISNIYLTDFRIINNFSVSNCFCCAIYNSIFEVFKYIILLKFINNKSDSNVEIKNEFEFFNNIFKLDLNIKLFVSILDICLALIKAYFSRSYKYE